MCTISWLTPAGGLEVFFNRDEKKTRPPAEPPRRHTCGSVPYLAAIDPQGGGTWLAVNRYGLCLALLNHYGAELLEPAANEPSSSRGLLVSSLLDVDSPQDAVNRLKKRPLAGYRPFLLVALHPQSPGWLQTWDGRVLVARPLEPGDRPLSTSSYATERVVAARRARYEEICRGPLAEDPAAHVRYHHDVESRGPYSVFMQRVDAETVSFSRVTVSKRRVRFVYEPRGRAALSCEMDRA